MVSIHVQSETHAEKWSAHTLESILLRYFVEKYYDMLLLPECPSDFYLGWINQIQAKLACPEYTCMHHSLLANAAANLHFVDAKPRMQVVALTYYSHALGGLSKLLAQGGTSEADDGLLMSVMLLYLHGVSGHQQEPRTSLSSLTLYSALDWKALTLMSLSMLPP